MWWWPLSAMLGPRQPPAQQIELYRKRSQLNENAEKNVPSTHGVPLEGEWEWCASGRVRDSEDSASTSSAAIEHADRLSGRGELTGVDRGESRSREDGMDERAGAGETGIVMRLPKGCCQLGRRDDDASCEEQSISRRPRRVREAHTYDGRAG